MTDPPAAIVRFEPVPAMIHDRATRPENPVLWMIGLILMAAPSALSQTIAYWRFEPGDCVVERGALMACDDALRSGNSLAAFSADTAPATSDSTPFGVVPQTGQPNKAAIDNSARPGARLPTRDLYVVGSTTAFNLNEHPLTQWTIEASVLFRPVERWDQRFQTFVGREGYNIADGPPDDENQLAALGFKKRGDNNRISIEAWDSGKHYVVVQSKRPVQADVWYHVAATSDGQSLSLWIKGPGDEGYVLQDSQPFEGALADTREMWMVGRGCYASAPAEQFFGLIDEVRISAAALPVERMLATPRSGVAPVETAPVARPAVAPSTTVRFPAATTRPADAVSAHDPAAIAVDGVYHVFASHRGVQHWRSRDLLHWESLPGVFEEVPQWTRTDIAQNAGLWAPDIAFFANRFHLYYSTSTFGSQRSAIGLAASDSLDPRDPKYGWRDLGKVIESFPGDDSNAIDASVLVDSTGQPWISWGSWNKGIYLAKLDPLTGMLASDAKPYHHLAARPGRDALEAPHLLEHKGRFYLIVSYDFCCRGARSTYKLMVGRADRITGPYLDRDGRRMLEGHASLVLRTYGDFRGPGQSSIVRQGEQSMLVHHYYDARANGVPTLAVRPLHWDSEGWPLVGEPLAEQSAETLKDLAGEWVQLLDDAKPAVVTFRPDGSIAGPAGSGHWQREGANLTIRWAATGQAPKALDRCFMAADGRSYVGRRSDGAIVRARRQL